MFTLMFYLYLILRYGKIKKNNNKMKEFIANATWIFTCGMVVRRLEDSPLRFRFMHFDVTKNTLVPLFYKSKL